MSIFVIADLHLSTSALTNKSMEVFGQRWDNYTERLRDNWTRLVNDGDTVVLPGDISWALSLEEARSDFDLINKLPGKKVILKGNHDFWWSTAAKMTRWLEACGFSTISFLHNDAIECENVILCGSRGWFTDRTTAVAKETDYEKISLREAQRIKLSLDAAAGFDSSKERIVFLHFPPIWNDSVCIPIKEVLRQYGIRRCYFGHIHSSTEHAPAFEQDGTLYRLIAADALSFIPYLVDQGK